MSDAGIAALAGRQDGIVTRAQLLAAGVSRDASTGASPPRRLFVIYRGVVCRGA